MDTFRADVKALLAKDAPTEQPEQTPQVTTGEITVGTVVQFKDSAETYNPTTKAIPNWVKKDYNHIPVRIQRRGNPKENGCRSICPCIH